MRCTHCGRDLPLEEFHHDRSRKSGHAPWCRDCKNARHRDYYAANRDRIRRQQNLHRAELARRAKLALRNRRGTKFLELKDEEWLRRKYLREFKSPQEIADGLGCSVSSVRKALSDMGIPTIPRSLHSAFRSNLEKTRA